MTITVTSSTGEIFVYRKTKDTYYFKETIQSPGEFESSVILLPKQDVSPALGLRVFAKAKGEKDQMVDETTLQLGETSYMFRGKGFPKVECR